MEESLVRFYTGDHKRVSHTLKKNVGKGRPKVIWVNEGEDADPDYKKINVSNIFDDDGGILAYPSNGRILSDLSKESLMEFMMDEEGTQKKYPSVTSIPSGVIAHDGLERWKINNAIDSVISQIQANGYIPADDSGEWVNIIKKAKQDASPTEAAERGSKWHGYMEKAFKGETITNISDVEAMIFGDVITGVRDYLGAEQPISVPEQFGKLERITPESAIDFLHKKKIFDTKDIIDRMFVMSTAQDEIEKRFVNKEHRYAGTADLRRGRYVFDYKFSDKPLYTKKGSFAKSIRYQKDHPLQLAAYAIGLGIKDPILVNFYIRIPGPKCPDNESGGVYPLVYSKETTERNMLLWKSLVMTWYLYVITNEKLWDKIKVSL